MDTSFCRLEDFSLPPNAETLKRSYTLIYLYYPVAGGVGHFLRTTTGPPSLTDNDNENDLIVQ